MSGKKKNDAVRLKGIYNLWSDCPQAVTEEQKKAMADCLDQVSSKEQGADAWNSFVQALTHGYNAVELLRREVNPTRRNTLVELCLVWVSRCEAREAEREKALADAEREAEMANEGK